MSTSLDGLPKKAFYTPKEVAEYFSVSVQTIYTWHNLGRIRGLKIAEKTLRIPRDEIVELITISQSSNE